VAGFKSERWPASNRNPGRLHVGTPGRIKSESAPKGFHRIRHYGLFAGSNRAKTIETVREFLNLVPPAAEETVAKENGETDPEQPLARPCPCCGGRMFVIETFEPGRQPRHRPTAPLVVIRIDTS
jgi:hypothetical protein